MHLKFSHAHFPGFDRGFFSGDLGGKRGALSRPFEALRPSAGPGNDIARQVGDGDNGVIERRADMGDAALWRNLVFSFPALAAFILIH